MDRSEMEELERASIVMGMDQELNVEKERKKTKKKFFKGMLLGWILSVMTTLGLILVFVLLSGDIQNWFVKMNYGTVELLDEDVLEKIDLISNTVQAYYIDDFDMRTLEEGIYRGVIDSLGDPYSVYYTEDELNLMIEMSSGVYYGIGAYVGIHLDKDMPQIARVIPNTPAEESGLVAEDILVQVDGIDTRGMSLEEVIALIKGDEGTIVNLTVYREGEVDYLEILVERRQIENQTVTYEMLDNQIAYISVLEFDTITESQFREALVVSEANQMEGMILDLRGNPGGNLTTVVEMLRMILPEGIIVYTEDKYGERVEYTGKGENPLETPLVVLVDGNSASAAEIMAGAIQDYGIGTVMGGTTYGKGIVQSIITLSDGTAVKLTISRYYTASGKEIHGVGIIPDVEVLFDAQTYVEYGIDNQLEFAIEYMQEQIRQ